MWIDFLLLLVISAVLVTFLSAVGWRQRWTPYPLLDLLVLVAFFFLALWAGTLWLVPAGPVLIGFSWVPLLGLGVFLVLLVGLGAPPRRRRRPSSQSDVVIEEQPDAADLAATVFLWLLFLFFLLLAIVTGYR